MSLTRSDLTVRGYKRGEPSTLDKDIRVYLQQELSRIEATLRDIAEATPQVADQPPKNPRKGTVRLAVSPWDPLGTSGDAWVWWNGSAWVAL